MHISICWSSSLQNGLDVVLWSTNFGSFERPKPCPGNAEVDRFDVYRIQSCSVCLPLILISREPGAPKHEPKNKKNRIWPIGLLLKSPTKLSCIICNIQGTLWIPIVASSRFHNPFWCDLISRLVVLRSCGLPCGGTRIFRTPAQCLQLTGLRCH